MGQSESKGTINVVNLSNPTSDEIKLIDEAVNDRIATYPRRNKNLNRQYPNWMNYIFQHTGMRGKKFPQLRPHGHGTASLRAGGVLGLMLALPLLGKYSKFLGVTTVRPQCKQNPAGVNQTTFIKDSTTLNTPTIDVFQYHNWIEEERYGVLFSGHMDSWMKFLGEQTIGIVLRDFE